MTEPNEAKWNGRIIDPVTPWIREALQKAGTPDKVPGTLMRLADEVHVGTRYGVMVCRPGDWIVRTADGELFCQTAYERELNASLVAA